MICSKCSEQAIVFSRSRLCQSHFIEDFERRVGDTVRKNDMVKEGDRIAVAVSGGKDSIALLFCLHKILAGRGVQLVAVTVDEGIAGYRDDTLKVAKEIAGRLGIEQQIVSFRGEFGLDLDEMVQGKDVAPCTFCGVFRKNALNHTAKRLGMSKVATGHNLDDEAESIMMNFFRNTLELSSRLGPVTGSIASKKFVPRVKPLYFCLEKYIERYSRKMNFPVVYDPCPCRNESFRFCVLQYLNETEKKNTDIKENIAKQFLKLLPKLKKKYAKGELMYCSLCGEPSKHNICQTCQILGKLIK